MKSTKTMTYKELENELFKNRCELRTASLERKRELITVRAAFRQSWSVAIAAASSAQKSGTPRTSIAVLYGNAITSSKPARNAVHRI